MNENKCILVTDDNPADFHLLKKALDECCPGVCVEWAEDADALINHLETSAHPDIVLLDINMPRKNGLEALAEIRERPEFSHIPIVMLTTSENDEHILKAYRNGSNTYVRKPFSYRDLKNFLSVFQHYWFEIATLPPRHEDRKAS